VQSEVWLTGQLADDVAALGQNTDKQQQRSRKRRSSIPSDNTVV
jgi:hypothetical protein